MEWEDETWVSDEAYSIVAFYKEAISDEKITEEETRYYYSNFLKDCERMEKIFSSHENSENLISMFREKVKQYLSN